MAWSSVGPPSRLLNADAKAASGLLLLAEGRLLTDAHLERMRRFAATAGIDEPLAVLVKHAV